MEANDGAEMAMAACQVGKHVSVRKPMALSVPEADRMIDAAEQAGVILRVYENSVFYPPYVRIKEMLDAGEIGVLRDGGQPVLDGTTGKAVLQFTLAAQISAREGREVRPDELH
jgi:hypothetical protein